MLNHKFYHYLPFLIIILLTGCGPSLKEFVSTSSTGNAFQAGPPDEFLTVTKKPLETRQGKGKGNVEYWASPVRPGKILYEVAGVSEKDAKKAFELASAKLPMATTFTRRGANG